jgi:single-stranded-DNA-specific exonuclease
VHYNVYKPNKDNYEKLKFLGQDHVSAILMDRRGVTPEKLKSYLSPKITDLRSPEHIPDFFKAVERIADAINKKQVIGIYGDYDCDGVTSTAILTTWLRNRGVKVVTKLAHRTEGYGFTETAATSLVSRVDLIIVFDCGTNDIDAIKYCNSKNIDVVVVDHHTAPDDVSNHPAFALVNPYRKDNGFPFQGFASAGLSYYITLGLRKLLGGKLDLDLLEIATIGTIADVMSLNEENRTLVKLGLERMQSSAFPGIRALLETSKTNGMITEKTVSHSLAPRLNAAGRMGSPELALQLLLSRSDSEALPLALELESINSNRKETQDNIWNSIKDTIKDDNSAIVVSGEWKAGVIGVIAAKIVDAYKKPALVMSIHENIAKGSARVPEGMNIYSLLNQCSDYLLKFGGHKGAAGFSLDVKNIDAFTSSINEAAKHLAYVPPTRVVDLELNLREVNLAMVSAMDRLRPFGAGHSSPEFAIKCSINSHKKIGDGSHLRLVLEDSNVTSAGVAFGKGSQEIYPSKDAIIIGYPYLNEFRGKKNLEIMIAEIIQNI